MNKTDGTSQLKRVVIVGTSSSGKTTFGRSLSQILNIEHIELDEFHWGPNWTPAKPEDFRQRVDIFTQKEFWIVDGNYSSVSDLVWKRATDIIWLDYPLLLILKRFFTRSVSRSITKEELWSGNRETVWNSIFSKESLLRWILKTYRRNKKRYKELSENDDYGHVNFVHIKSPKEAKEFLGGIK